MKRLSVKFRMTLWYLVLMAAMAALMLAFMLAISSTVVTQSGLSRLNQTVRSNLGQVDLADGKLTLSDQFRFYQDGVYTLIYSQSEALLAGQLPVAFTGVSEPFQNGLTRPVDTEEGEYYVFDLWLPLSWEEGVWVRGLMEAPRQQATALALLTVAALSTPLFLLLAALGGYWVVRRAFRPLDDITATAAAINEARDLSARIHVPGGGSEFARLADTFNQMLERLERSFEAEKQFTADASHELRTPISVIQGACEYAEAYDETPEEYRESLAMISRQSRKMSALVSQLLSMTRLEQGTESARLAPTDLTGLVAGLCEDLAREPGSLIPELEPGIQADVDAVLLPRLVQNLVENAYKYGKPAGHVWVSLRRQGDEILLSVRDDGIGIPKEQQEQIWQRFYQVDPARSGGAGAGLGLSIVQQIARLHGGTVTVESVPLLGSTFTLHLPKQREK